MSRSDRQSSSREQPIRAGAPATVSNLDEAIASYLRAREFGEEPPREEWLRRYPQFQTELAEFFADQDRVDDMVAQPTMISDHDFSGDESGRDETPKQSGGAFASTADHAPDRLQPDSDRYRVKNFLARGGMGEVWLGEDSRIGRRVAFKKLRGKHREQRERFLIEAQITGQLEHPSIMPLHDLGFDKEGRPFYIMKYVQGTTLKDAILDHHRPKPSGATGGLSAGERAIRTPGDEQPVPPETEAREVRQLRLLEVFLDLCHAVAFAHSRGVLHRDLKPDNVMLGPFGETVVLDWGLAKLIGEPEQPENISYVRVSSSGGSTETQDGAIVGSLAYLAPEVADGRIQEVDERTDVYLLGATLYEILTGRLPREGSSPMELIELARTVTPAPPRRIDPGIPRPLEAICLKAMSRRVEDRYQSALQVAEDVQRYLAGEAVSAYRESLLERSWRWCRKHSRLLKRSAVAAVFVAGVLFAWSIHQENRQLRAVQQASADVEEFRRLADEVRYYAASSDPATERAPYYDLRKGDASGRAAIELAESWGRDLSEFPLQDQRPELRRELYELLLLIVQERLERHPAADSAGDLIASLDRAAGLREPTGSYYRLRADCYALGGENSRADQARRRMNDPRIPTTAMDHFLSGERYRTQSRSATNPQFDPQTNQYNQELLKRAVEEYRLALENDPRHYWSHLQLGRCYLSLGRDAEAIEILGACVALRPDSPWGYIARASALMQMERYAEADTELRRLLDREPGFLPARLVRGRALQLQGRLEEALKVYDAALSVRADQRLITAAYYRGEIYLKQAQDGDYTKALKDFDWVVHEDPGFYPVYLTRAQVDFARGQDELGMKDLNSFLFLAGKGKFDNESWQADHRRGRFLRWFYLRVPESASKRRQAIAELMHQQLTTAVEKGGRSVELFRDLGFSLEWLKQPKQAVDVYTQGLELAPDDAPLRVMRAWAKLSVGDVDGSVEDFEYVVQHHSGHAEAHTGLGYLRAALKRRAGAEQNAVRALLLGRDDYRVLHNVSCIYAELSKTEKVREHEYLDLAVLVLREAADRSKPDASGRPGELVLIDAETAFPLAMTKRPDFQEIVRTLKEAVSDQHSASDRAADR